MNKRNKILSFNRPKQQAIKIKTYKCNAIQIIWIVTCLKHTLMTEEFKKSPKFSQLLKTMITIIPYLLGKAILPYQQITLNLKIVRLYLMGKGQLLFLIYNNDLQK